VNPNIFSFPFFVLSLKDLKEIGIIGALLFLDFCSSPFKALNENRRCESP